jgi:hypothetical protein
MTAKPTAEPAIHVQGLEKSFKKLDVLRGVGPFDTVTNALTQPRAGQRLRQTGQIRCESGARNAVGWTTRRLHAVLGVLRQLPSADARIQRIEDRVQPTLAGLTCRHLEQDLARFSGGVLDCPADLAVGDPWIAIAVELKGQGGIGRWTDDVLRLMDIRQGMRVGAGRRKARGASGGGGRRIADLTRSGMRLHGKGTQPGRALSPARELPDARDRRTWPCI